MNRAREHITYGTYFSNAASATHTVLRGVFTKYFSIGRGRGISNGKAGKAATFPKFSDMLTLSQSGRADYVWFCLYT